MESMVAFSSGRRETIGQDPGYLGSSRKPGFAAPGVCFPEEDIPSRQKINQGLLKFDEDMVSNLLYLVEPHRLTLIPRRASLL